MDINYDRISMDTYDAFRIPQDNLLSWWLHERTVINLDVRTGNVTLYVKLHPEDAVKYAGIIQHIYIDKFKEKNKDIIGILRRNSIPIAMDSESKVISTEFAPPLKILTEDNSRKLIRILETEINRNSLRSEVSASIKYRSPIPEERLKPHLEIPEVFFGLSEEEWISVLLSAIQCMIDDAEIARIISGEGEMSLIRILRDPDYPHNVRRRVIRVMAIIDKPIFWEALVSASRDSDQQVRYEALGTIGKIREINAVEPLICALDDPIDFIREEAARSLGYLHDPHVIEPLISVLRSDHSNIRVIAINSLIGLGKLSVEPLMGLLKDPKESVRKAASLALGEIGDKRSLKSLKDLLDDKDINVRKAAIIALGLIGDQSAVEPILALFLDTQNEARYEAVEALGCLRDKHATKSLISALKDSDINIRKQSAKSLGKLRDILSVEPLIDVLIKDEGIVSAEAAKSLGDLSDHRAVEPLISKLTCNDWNTRACSAEALGKIKDKRAVNPLIKALKDGDVSVRLAAIKSLGSLGDTTAIGPIADSIHDEDWDEHRAAAKRNYKFFIDDEPRLTAIRWWREDLDSLHRAAIQAIACFDIAYAFKSLLSMLNDEDSVIRDAAADMFGKLECHNAVEPLLNALKKGKLTVAAAKALGEIGDERAVDGLVNCLHDDFSDLRRAAAEALGKIGDKKAVGPLIDALQQDREIDVAVTCIEALGALRDPRATKPLLDALVSELGALRVSARKALANSACWESINSIKA